MSLFGKYAICQELYEGWDWDRQCQFSFEVGYRGMEIAPFTIAQRIDQIPQEKLLEIRRVAESRGLEIIGLHWLLAKTTGLHLTSSERAVQRETTEYLRELGRACSILGGQLLVLGSPMQRNLAAGVTREQGADNAFSVIQPCLDDYAKWGVKLCLEPLTPKETNFWNTCAEAQEMVERLNHPAVCIHQDVKAMLSEPTPIPELIRSFAGKVGHFHVNDSNLLGPGMGPTDYTPILQALEAVRYSGWISLEVFDYSPGPKKIARESLDYLERVRRKLNPM